MTGHRGRARCITAAGGLVALLFAATVRADDVLHVGAASLDRPTLVTVGVQLLVTGDDNRDGQVTVRSRVSGGTWRAAMSLFRVHPEDVGGLTVPDQFAGSIFDLAPATPYDIELHVTDPDGPVDEIVLLTATTRSVPADPATPSSKLVTTAGELQAALDSAAPGDVITLADGTYAGPFELAASGTAANPIVIRGASQSGVVLDGGGCDCNLLEITASFVHVERLTLRNALRALRFKGVGAEGNVARRVLIQDVENGVIGDPDQRDFYVCDNAVEGRLVWPHVYTDDDGRHASDDGINVKGAGHVVCHNVIAGFGDAMKVEEDGARADDFYGNDVRSAYDNGVELDGSAGNVRAFRNRFTNTFVPISVQPIFGGPAYVVRNVIVNAAEEAFKFYARAASEEPNGVLILHNTSVSAGPALTMQSTATSHHFRFLNNLLYGSDGGTAADWTGGIDDGSFDYDGWFPDGVFAFHGAGTWPSFAVMQSAGIFEAHGTLLGLPIFASSLAPPASFRTTMSPSSVVLAPGSSARDRGVPLANVNDGYGGGAPDLGALEADCPTPIFGLRPLDIDETNEPYGCGGPAEVATPTLVRTTSLKLKDASDAGARRFSFKANTRRDAVVFRVVLPNGGSLGDPTIHGATLAVYNATGTGESAVLALPAAGWMLLGKPTSPSGYRFRGAPGGPVATAIVKRDRLTIKGGGANWPYTLHEPSQGRIAIRLALGSEQPWCAEAPAKSSGNPPSTVRNDRPGLFAAAPKTPPPPSCAPLP